MASQYMAQEVLICDRCKIAPAQKYCNKCETNLCDGCVAKHILSDKTKSHDIVTYELKNEGPNFPYCKTHAKHQCEMFCKECDSPICVKCVTSGSHRNHAITDMLEKICIAEKEIIAQDTEALEKYIYPTIENGISDLKSKLAELSKNHEKLLDSISELGTEWHREIDAVIEKRKEEAEKMKTQYLFSLQKLLGEMKNLLSALQQVIQDNKQLLKSNKFSEMKRYKSRMSEFKRSPTKFDVNPPTFKPVPIPKDQLDKMFGSLKSSSVYPHTEIISSISSAPKQSSTDSRKFRSEFHTRYDVLCDVACHSPDEIWVRGDDKDIKKFNHKGSLQQTVTTTTGKWPGGITVTLQGELIYTDQGDNNIYIVRNGKPQKMITVQGWAPWKLCYTAWGDLLVSMHKDQIPKKVVQYRGSTEKQVFQFDRNGSPWFSTGWDTLFIDENRNGDLCASDWKAMQVIVINRAEKLRFRYTGNLSANKYTSFKPNGIATDSESQIIVADQDNNSIHIISEDGHFVCYIDNFQLSQPWGLTVDTSNTLYVAENDTAKVKMIEYMK